MITIIIADDQKLFATSLKSVLENDDKELSVIGIAGNGKEAVDLAGQLKPDLILMDVRMPIMDGVEAVRIIHQRLPEIKIIMLILTATMNLLTKQFYMVLPAICSKI